MKTFSFFIALAALSLAPAPGVLHAEMSHFGLNTSAPNLVKIEIPAPLETTRARLTGVRGALDVDLNDPNKTTGSIEADLSGIQSYSFSDPDKNKTQTEHMHNWFEIGGDVTPDVRAKNQWAKFVITKIVKAEAVEPNKKYVIEAQGDFTVHGITKPKTVDLEVTLDDSKKSMTLVTKKPFVVSLKEHDIKPRDTTGKFLNGALQVVGLKLSDEAQVSLDLKAVQLPPPGAK